MKVRNELGRFVGSKYKKVNGVWYKGKCQDCNTLIKSHRASRCKPCRGKQIRGVSVPPRHTVPHSKETIEYLRKINTKTILTYSGIHCWLRREYGAAHKCENLDCIGKSNYFDWAKVEGEYIKDRLNYMMLCRSCHKLYDMNKIEVRT